MRPALASRFPVHVTLKCVASAPVLRWKKVYPVVHGAFVDGRDRLGFRLVQFTVQGNHIHLVVEAPDRVRLARGVQGLCVRTAKRLNARLGRKGRLFAERYHARILKTPTEVRRVLAYVLNNSRRHCPADATIPRDWIDVCSSAPWFDGWQNQPRLYAAPEPDIPVVPPGTWLLREGWRRHGLLRTFEVPGPVRRGR